MWTFTRKTTQVHSNSCDYSKDDKKINSNSQNNCIKSNGVELKNAEPHCVLVNGQKEVKQIVKEVNNKHFQNSTKQSNDADSKNSESTNETKKSIVPGNIKEIKSEEINNRESSNETEEYIVPGNIKEIKSEEINNRESTNETKKSIVPGNIKEIKKEEINNRESTNETEKSIVPGNIKEIKNEEINNRESSNETKKYIVPGNIKEIKSEEINNRESTNETKKYIVPGNIKEIKKEEINNRESSKETKKPIAMETTKVINKGDIKKRENETFDDALKGKNQADLTEVVEKSNLLIGKENEPVLHENNKVHKFNIDKIKPNHTDHQNMPTKITAEPLNKNQGKTKPPSNNSNITEFKSFDKPKILDQNIQLPNGTAPIKINSSTNSNVTPIINEQMSVESMSLNLELIDQYDKLTQSPKFLRVEADEFVPQFSLSENPFQCAIEADEFVPQFSMQADTFGSQHSLEDVELMKYGSLHSLPVACSNDVGYFDLYNNYSQQGYKNDISGNLVFSFLEVVRGKNESFSLINENNSFKNNSAYSSATKHSKKQKKNKGKREGSVSPPNLTLGQFIVEKTKK
jgi:hypothetical protein